MNIVKSFTTIDLQLNLDRCVGSYNTLNDLSNKLCIPKKTEDLNPSVFNMITWINESKILRKHISCEYKCKSDGTKFNSNQWWNNDKCRCKCKKEHICDKDFGILLLAAVKMENI